MEQGEVRARAQWVAGVWRWLYWLNAFLNRAYEEADVTTGC